MIRTALAVAVVVGRCSGFVTSATRARTALCATVERSVSDPLVAENYIALGLAKVFMLNGGGSPTAQYLVEPLTAATLETLQLGVPTSYCRVLALTCGDLFDDVAEPSSVNLASLATLTADYEDVKLCEDMIERATAAARTFRRRVEATQFIPVYQTSEDLNFNTDRKRIMDFHFEPSFDDNVKQHSSIDVYGRTDDSDDLADEIKRLAES
mmetsp:Transcript_19979/g.62839  ORF Transcript_19979/g.62839 Transcript_19979/m.62839 type:complete len:211 (+) Transcript_19979:36-668(+)